MVSVLLETCSWPPDPLQALPHLIQLPLYLLSLCVLLLKPRDQLILFLKGWCSS